MFTERINNSGYDGGSTGQSGVLVPVVPLGFLLTQYTITGFDASAHLSEETEDAATAAAKGIWRSIFYSAIGGYILLLALPSRSPTTPRASPTTPSPGFGALTSIFVGGTGAATGRRSCCCISTVGQFFCATSLHDLRLPDDLRVQP